MVKRVDMILLASVIVFIICLVIMQKSKVEAASPTAVASSVPIEVYTATPTPTVILFSESTPSPTPTGEITPISIYIPFTIKQPEPTPTPPPVESLKKVLFCNSETLPIPDDQPDGISTQIDIPDPRYIIDLDVKLDVEHTWIGDLVINLTHLDSGRSINLIDRPGVPTSDSGCGEDNIEAILDDEISSPVENKCSTIAAGTSGIYIPEQPLNTFVGELVTGGWNLSVSDHFKDDIGRLNEWCMAATLYDYPIPPTEPPVIPPLPDQAFVSGVTGRRQSLPLDCESRSAVDWANYFGVDIDEIEFFHNLPESENPDKGFVGNVYGTWGQIPPAPYGVHAEPVAELLRQYGLEAQAHRPLTWDQLRSEIATGRPVIVWILGASIQGAYAYVVNGIPEYYIPPDGNLTIVARYEHTVIVTGYTPDSITFLNGGSLYTKDLEQFLDSWSALGNMAITTQP